MKKSNFTNAALAFTITIMFIGCNTSSEKVEDAKQDVIEANKDLAKANEEYLADLENFRKVVAERIATNDQIIIDFNERISKEKKEAREEYRKKINALDLKNSDMKKKIAEYKSNGKDSWEMFKTEFNHDMDELGKAFTDLTKDNVK